MAVMKPAAEQFSLFAPRLADLRELMIFRSGASRPADFRGFMKAGVPIGIQIPDCSRRVLALASEAADAGIPVFVDSGEFSRFTASLRAAGEGREPPPALDFERVFTGYLDIAVATRYRENLYLVAPDRIGDPDGTWSLQQHYAPLMRELLGLGTHLIAPAQVGAGSVRSAAQAYRRLNVLLGDPERLILGVPCNKSAITLEALDSLLHETRPRRVHLLGVAADQTHLSALVEVATRYLPIEAVACDANRLRAWINGLFREVRPSIERDLMVESAHGSDRDILGGALQDWDETEVDLMDLEPETLRSVLTEACCPDIDDYVALAAAGDEGFYECLDYIDSRALGLAVQNVIMAEDFRQAVACHPTARGELRAETVAQATTVSRQRGYV